MTNRPPRALRSFAGVLMTVALVAAGCEEAARLPATATPAARLGATCAAQWAASISTYSDGSAGSIPVVLMPSRGTEAPAIQPTAAALQTDQGSLELTVAPASSDEDDALSGTTRLELGLPVLDPGTYRAEFLDLADESGTWRFRIGELVVKVLADDAPGDLEFLGGTGRTAGFTGGWVQFEVRLHNLTDQAIEVTGATTDIPGLPVTWDLVAFDPTRAVDHVSIPPDERASLTIATDHTQKPVAFVLTTPEITYRVGTSAERGAMCDPIEFQVGIGQLSDMMAYRATLPADACGQHQQ